MHDLLAEWVWARDQSINRICARSTSSRTRVGLEILLNSSIGLFQYLDAILALGKLVLATRDGLFHPVAIAMQSCLEVDKVIECIFSVGGQVTCHYVNSVNRLLLESVDTINIATWFTCSSSDV